MGYGHCNRSGHVSTEAQKVGPRKHLKQTLEVFRHGTYGWLQQNHILDQKNMFTEKKKKNWEKMWWQPWQPLGSPAFTGVPAGKGGSGSATPRNLAFRNWKMKPKNCLRKKTETLMWFLLLSSFIFITFYNLLFFFPWICWFRSVGTSFLAPRCGWSNLFRSISAPKIRWFRWQQQLSLDVIMIILFFD